MRKITNSSELMSSPMLATMDGYGHIELSQRDGSMVRTVHLQFESEVRTVREAMTLADRRDLDQGIATSCPTWLANEYAGITGWA